jgi:hypothetical protein
LRGFKDPDVSPNTARQILDVVSIIAICLYSQAFNLDRGSGRHHKLSSPRDNGTHSPQASLWKWPCGESDILFPTIRGILQDGISGKGYGLRSESNVK